MFSKLMLLYPVGIVMLVIGVALLFVTMRVQGRLRVVLRIVAILLALVGATLLLLFN